MMNQVLVVGRLFKDVEVIETESGKKKCVITLACTRPYKNSDGVYDTDFIDCVLWNGIAENTSEYCHKGDIVGIRGRIQTDIIEERKITTIVADKITFLSSKKNEE